VKEEQEQEQEYKEELFEISHLLVRSKYLALNALRRHQEDLQGTASSSSSSSSHALRRHQDFIQPLV
jgi:hypothetical protein